MKILMTGNMGSGKSTLARRLTELRPALAYHAIDDYRKSFGDGTMEKEKKAIETFLGAICQPNPMLIECMGLGNLGLEVQRILWNASATVILLEVPLETCLDRLATRRWDIPYPGTPETAIMLARDSQIRYESQEIQRRFDSVSNGGVRVFPHTSVPESIAIQNYILNLIDYNETT